MGVGKLIKIISYRSKVATELKKNSAHIQNVKEYKLFDRIRTNKDPAVQKYNTLGTFVGESLLKERFKGNTEMLSKINKEFNDFKLKHLWHISYKPEQVKKIVIQIRKDISRLPDDKVLDYLKNIDKLMAEKYPIEKNKIEVMIHVL